MKLSLGKYNPNAPYKLRKDFKYDNKWFKNLAKEYDEISTITNEVAKELKDVCDFQKYAIGIHRTGYSNVTPEYLDDVFNNGLINNGDAMQGVTRKYVDLEKTVSIIENYTILIGVLKTGHNYKNSDGMLLIKIPKEDIDSENPNRKPIFFNDSGIPRLLPEYIYGYIPSDKDGNIDKIVHNYNYKDKHDYSDEGLLKNGDEISKMNSYK